jgi:hypothetical protein
MNSAGCHVVRESRDAPQDGQRRRGSGTSALPVMGWRPVGPGSNSRGFTHRMLSLIAYASCSSSQVAGTENGFSKLATHLLQAKGMSGRKGYGLKAVTGLPQNVLAVRSFPLGLTHVTTARWRLGLGCEDDQPSWPM